MARIAVLMSGGVDSSAAAYLLHRRGHEVTGITAKMWDGASRCCDLDDIYRAQRVCHKLAIPHVVLDLTRDFERYVVTPFVESYLDGRTPNPCALCNREIKLGKIADLAVRAGFDRIATGHYARIRSAGAMRFLCEPADRRKSQVYFLSLVRPEVLNRLEFPLQELGKGRVRQMVLDLGLPARDGESQDLCFVSSGRYEELLKDRAGATGPGRVLNADGRAVGTHSGHWSYTVGQRFGVNGKRCYVVEKLATSNEIVIAERGQALMSRITVTGLNFFLPLEEVKRKTLTVKHRYNSAPVAANIAEVDGERLIITTAVPCFAPAPGQILACYYDNCLVFGGIIETASP
jgi:tRNA-specific 2-thiouridylase